MRCSIDDVGAPLSPAAAVELREEGNGRKEEIAAREGDRLPSIQSAQRALGVVSTLCHPSSTPVSLKKRARRAKGIRQFGHVTRSRTTWTNMVIY